MSPNHDVGMPVRFGITCEPNIYTADTDDVIGEHCRPPTPRLPEALRVDRRPHSTTAGFNFPPPVSCVEVGHGRDLLDMPSFPPCGQGSPGMR